MTRKSTSQYWQLIWSILLCFSAVFPFNLHWWCNVEVAPTVIGKTCQVILESHSSEKIKRIKNGTQFCPNRKASNGQHCSSSVWTNVPQAKISTAVSPPLLNEQNTGFVDSLRLISKRYGALLIWLKMLHLEAVFVTTVLKITALRHHHASLRQTFFFFFFATARVEHQAFRVFHSTHFSTPLPDKSYFMILILKRNAT